MPESTRPKPLEVEYDEGARILRERYHTARKQHLCRYGASGAGRHHIEPGQRYMELVFYFPGGQLGIERWCSKHS